MAYLDYDGLAYFKGKLDASYPNLTVGNANQLLADNGVEDKVPYNFRRSGGGADVGDREIDKIVGGTIAWNQLNMDLNTIEVAGITCTDNGDGSCTVVGTASANNSLPMTRNLIPLISNHVYLLPPIPNFTPTTTCYLSFSGVTIGTRNGGIWKNTPGYTGGYVRLEFYSGDSVNFKYYPQWFDLTQMFGSTVADRFLALEQATAGAGVALFRSLFPKAYYPYNAGELMSVNTSAHTMVGFNQWDEELEVGYLNTTTGQPESNSNWTRTKNFCPCLPNTDYYCVAPTGTNIHVYWYDANKNFISNQSLFENHVRTSPANAAYFKFINAVLEYGGTTYKGDICVNISDASKNGAYEPYHKYTYPLDDSLTLRGIPKLDANNKLYYDGDTYESDGTVTRRYGIVDLGSLTWDYGSSRFLSNAVTGIKKPADNNTTIQTFSTLFYPGNYNFAAYGSDNNCIGVSTEGKLGTKGLGYTDSATFTTAMSGVYLVYELATPTTETADPYQNPQAVDLNGTEEYVDERTVAVPVGHDTLYLENLRAKIEGLPWDMSMLAPIENGATASQAYEQGKYFLRNNKFCKATTAIASGATFTLGTNYEETTVGAELYAALNS